MAPGIPASEYYDGQSGFDVLPANCLTSGNLILHVLGCVGAQGSTSGLVRDQIEGTALHGQSSSISVQATLDDVAIPGSQFSYSQAGPSPQTGTGANTYYPVTPGPYTLTYLGGGPSANPAIWPAPTQVLGPFPDHWTGYNDWNLTFTSSPTSTPTVATLPATAVDGGDATVAGTVNPNGAPAAAWFEWGTDPTLASPNTTPVQPAGP